MIPYKMLVPGITPGMKQRYDLAANRIASDGLIILEIIAPLAGQREIISGRVTSSIERVNVFDGKALCRMRFLTQAILAVALCTLTHEQPHRFVRLITEHERPGEVVWGRTLSHRDSTAQNK